MGEVNPQSPLVRLLGITKDGTSPTRDVFVSATSEIHDLPSNNPSKADGLLRTKDLFIKDDGNNADRSDPTAFNDPARVRSNWLRFVELSRKDPVTLTPVEQDFLKEDRKGIQKFVNQLTILLGDKTVNDGDPAVELNLEYVKSFLSGLGTIVDGEEDITLVREVFAKLLTFTNADGSPLAVDMRQPAWIAANAKVSMASTQYNDLKAMQQFFRDLLSISQEGVDKNAPEVQALITSLAEALQPEGDPSVPEPIVIPPPVPVQSEHVTVTISKDTWDRLMDTGALNSAGDVNDQLKSVIPFPADKQEMEIDLASLGPIFDKTLTLESKNRLAVILKNLDALTKSYAANVGDLLKSSEFQKLWRALLEVIQGDLIQKYASSAADRGWIAQELGYLDLTQTLSAENLQDKCDFILDPAKHKYAKLKTCSKAFEVLIALMNGINPKTNSNKVNCKDFEKLKIPIGEPESAFDAAKSGLQILAPEEKDGSMYLAGIASDAVFESLPPEAKQEWTQRLSNLKTENVLAAVNYSKLSALPQADIEILRAFFNTIDPKLVAASGLIESTSTLDSSETKISSAVLAREYLKARSKAADDAARQKVDDAFLKLFALFMDADGNKTDGKGLAFREDLKKSVAGGEVALTPEAALGLLHKAFVLTAGEDRLRASVQELMVQIVQDDRENGGKIRPETFIMLQTLLAQARTPYAKAAPAPVVPAFTGPTPDQIKQEPAKYLQQFLEADHKLNLACLSRIAEIYQTAINTAHEGGKTEEEATLTQSRDTFFEKIITALKASEDGKKIFSDANAKSGEEERSALLAKLKSDGENLTAAANEFVAAPTDPEKQRNWTATSSKSVAVPAAESLALSTYLKDPNNTQAIDDVAKKQAEEAAKKAAEEAKKNEPATPSDPARAQIPGGGSVASMNPYGMMLDWPGAPNNWEESSIERVPSNSWVFKTPNLKPMKVLEANGSGYAIQLDNGEVWFVYGNDPSRGLKVRSFEKKEKDPTDTTKEVSVYGTEIVPCKFDGTEIKEAEESGIARVQLGASGCVQLPGGCNITVQPANVNKDGRIVSSYINFTSPGKKASYLETNEQGRMGPLKPVVDYMSKTWEGFVKNGGPAVGQYDPQQNAIVSNLAASPTYRPLDVFPPVDVMGRGQTAFVKEVLEALTSTSAHAKKNVTDFVKLLKEDKHVRDAYFQDLRRVAAAPNLVTPGLMNPMAMPDLQRAREILSPNFISDLEQRLNDLSTKPDAAKEAQLVKDFGQVNWAIEAIRSACEEELRRMMRRATKQEVDIDQLLAMWLAGNISFDVVLQLLLAVLLPQTDEEIAKCIKDTNNLTIEQKNFRSGDYRNGNEGYMESLRTESALLQARLTNLTQQRQRLIETITNAQRTDHEAKENAIRRIV